MWQDISTESASCAKEGSNDFREHLNFSADCARFRSGGGRPAFAWGGPSVARGAIRAFPYDGCYAGGCRPLRSGGRGDRPGASGFNTFSSSARRSNTGCTSTSGFNSYNWAYC